MKDLSEQHWRRMNCSQLFGYRRCDIFFRDGKLFPSVADKKFVGRNIFTSMYSRRTIKHHLQRTYRDGKKERRISNVLPYRSMTRDKEYDVTQGTPDSRITLISAPTRTEKLEIIKVTLKPNPRTTHHLRTWFQWNQHQGTPGRRWSSPACRYINYFETERWLYTRRT